MIFEQVEQEILINKLKEVLSDVEFGRISCNLVISDKYLMYVDFKQEKNERLYIHNKSENKEGDKNE